MFKTIIITKPAFFDGEADMITQFLRQGRADLLHIRKPSATIEQTERLISEISPDCWGRLVLHDHHSLAVEYGLYGVHLNSRNPLPPKDWSGSVSRSCHSLKEVTEWKEKCDYVSLSPIFDSISKNGYLSAFTPDDIAAATQCGIIDNKVFALGGVTFNRLQEVQDMGFGGAMILGDAWKSQELQGL